jgi:hypothetical protein
MDTIQFNLDPDAQLVADCLTKGIPVPPEVVRRIHDRSQKAREQLVRSHGILDSGVQLIREIRGPLPES